MREINACKGIPVCFWRRQFRFWAVNIKLFAHDSKGWQFVLGWAGSSATPWCQMFLHALESVGGYLGAGVPGSQASTGKTGSFFFLPVVSYLTCISSLRRLAFDCSQGGLVPKEGMCRFQDLFKPRPRSHTVLLSPHYVGHGNSQNDSRFKGGRVIRHPLNLEVRNGKVIC